MEYLIGSRIKSLREERTLSQEDLGKLIGLSRLSIGNYERGDRKPDSDIIVKLCEYFDVDADYLLGRTNIKKDDLKKQNCKINLLSLGQQNEINELINSITDTVMRYKNTDLRLSDRLTDEIIPHLFKQLIAFNFLLDNVKESYESIYNLVSNANSDPEFDSAFDMMHEAEEIINTAFEDANKFEAVMGKLPMRIIVRDSFAPIRQEMYYKITGRTKNK